VDAFSARRAGIVFYLLGAALVDKAAAVSRRGRIPTRSGARSGDLEGLAKLAERYRVNKIEGNFGDGMFAKLLQPHLTARYPIWHSRPRLSLPPKVEVFRRSSSTFGRTHPGAGVPQFGGRGVLGQGPACRDGEGRAGQPGQGHAEET
jgi:hypothetical protein